MLVISLIAIFVQCIFAGATTLDLRGTGCEDGVVDLLFIMDGSGSIGEENFALQKAFTKHVAAPVLSSDTGSRVGIIQYSNEDKITDEIMYTGNQADFETGVDGIAYHDQKTFTASAMFYANNEFIPQHARSDVFKIAFIITDGKADDFRDLPNVATIFKNNFKVFVIGIGGRVKEKDLVTMASLPLNRHYFKAINFKDLESVSVVVATAVCESVKQGFNKYPGSCVIVKYTSVEDTFEENSGTCNAANTVKTACCTHPDTGAVRRCVCKCADGFRGTTCDDTETTTLRAFKPIKTSCEKLLEVKSASGETDDVWLQANAHTEERQCKYRNTLREDTCEIGGVMYYYCVCRKSKIGPKCLGVKPGYREQMQILYYQPNGCLKYRRIGANAPYLTVLAPDMCVRENTHREYACLGKNVEGSCDVCGKRDRYYCGCKQGWGGLTCNERLISDAPLCDGFTHFTSRQELMLGTLAKNNCHSDRTDSTKQCDVFGRSRTMCICKDGWSGNSCRTAL